MLSSLPVLRASPSEKTLKFAIVSFSGPEFSANTEFHPPQRVAGSLGHALASASFGNKRLHFRGRFARAALQRDYWNAGKTLELQSDVGVGSHGRHRGDRDRSINPPRIIRNKTEVRHLTNSNAVEQHACTNQKSRYRAIKLNVIGRAHPKATSVVKPIDKAESGDNGRQDKGADNDEGSTGFHVLARLRLQHLGALAVKIGPDPGVLGVKQFAHRSDGHDLAISQRRDAVADGIEACQIMRHHKNS